MKSLSRLIILAITCGILLVACAPQHVDGIPVYGDTSGLSQAELKDAVAVAKNALSRKISSIDVVSRNTIHVYVTPRDLGWVPFVRFDGQWITGSKSIWQLPAAMQLIRSAPKVYIFPIKTPQAPHRDVARQRLLGTKARAGLARILGNKAHWWQGLYTIACVGTERQSIGLVFQAKGQTLVLFFGGCIVEGTMNDQNISGLFGAGTDFKSWKNKFAAPELDAR